MREEKQGRRKKQDLKLSAAVLLLCLLLSVIFYCAGGLKVYHADNSYQATIDTAVSSLKARESEIPADLSGYRAKSDPVDIEELEERLLQHYEEYDYNSQYFGDWFSNAVIIGDSVAAAIKEFGYMDDSRVQAIIGIGTYSAEEVIENTIYIQPSVIFTTFSANDMVAFEGNVDAFIYQYRADIEKLMAGVPTAEIYVQGVLPCSPYYLDSYPAYADLDEFNEALSEMCDELGVHYYDVGFICEYDAEIFDEDGLHPRWPFYPLWLTYMAEISGLAEYPQEAAQD